MWLAVGAAIAGGSSRDRRGARAEPAPNDRDCRLVGRRTGIRLSRDGVADRPTVPTSASRHSQQPPIATATRPMMMSSMFPPPSANPARAMTMPSTMIAPAATVGSTLTLLSGSQAIEPEEVVLDRKDLDRCESCLIGIPSQRVGRMTVPVATLGSRERPSGRQVVMLHPYMNRSSSSPGAVNSSATRSSTTTREPPGASERRTVARTGTGFDMSWTASMMSARSKVPSSAAASPWTNSTASARPPFRALARAASIDGPSRSTPTTCACG